jgi:hypothetical protein
VGITFVLPAILQEMPLECGAKGDLQALGSSLALSIVATVFKIDPVLAPES